MSRDVASECISGVLTVTFCLVSPQTSVWNSLGNHGVTSLGLPTVQSGLSWWVG